MLMRRIDAMQPHRAGILRLFEDLKQDPLLALLLLASLPKSMAWMLEAAGLGSGGLAGLARAQGLTAVWLAVVRAWKDDDTADLGPTMAALDRALDRAGFAIIATGLQHCMAEEGQMDGDRDRMRARLEKLFLSLA